MEQDREFELSDKDFNAIRKLVVEHTGISLSDAKRDMVYSRLVRRLRNLGLGSFHEYCQLLLGRDGDAEMGEFINSITTNLTSFFRESHHFDYLAKQLLPECLSAKRHDVRLRIWSAGCSTGEEPYSIAMTLLENLPKNQNWDVKILATDLDTNVLETARRGVYPEERLNGIDEKRRRRWFKRGREENAGLLQVRPELREMIRFNQLNLMKDWPMQGPFDMIFCRNVLIYFDKPTQSFLMERFASLLADHARLFIGHSETLYRVTEQFKLLGQTVYRKVA